MIRTPIKRFKDFTKERNLWIYILFLGKDQEIIRDTLNAKILEKFDFLPNSFKREKVLFELEQDGFIVKERFQSKKAYKTTEKGKEELQKMITYTEELLEKLKK
ncbi:MAG: PadR family transcriptional regulator [Candidatus Pacebacteria bacterium]|nr:PadR family transcriptional regulator [Candidatus Paceibacterota bacterium]MDD4333780.1 PadR family transcriptional regulator [Candidatus Paceibacterota bacterium]